VQIRALSALSCLVAGTSKAKQSLLRHGGCALLVKTLSRWGASADICEFTARLVASVAAQNGAARKELVDLGACDLLVTAVQGNKANRFLFAALFAAAAALAPLNEAKERLGRIIKPILDMIRQYPSEADLQASSVGALRAIAADHTANSALVQQQHGYEAVVCGLVGWKDEATVLDHASGLIWDLKPGEVEAAVRRDLRETGALEDLVASVKGHGKDKLLHAHCWRVVSRLAHKDEDMKTYLRSLGVCELVVGSMRTFARYLPLQGYGCGAILNLADDCPANERALLAAGGLKAVEAALAHFPADILVQLQGHEAIRRLRTGVASPRAVQLV
jgi:hypothetical protein